MADKVKYQTLPEFMASPFGRGQSLDNDTKYHQKYLEFINTQKITLKAVTEIEGAWYYLIKIPSETNKDTIAYDVVIRFFADSKEVESESSLRNYKIQFFSNSPSFIFQYAYLYLKAGYGIELLYDKLDKTVKTTPPKNSNPNNIIMYDKSIYYACKYLSTKRFEVLGKRGPINLKKVRPNEFFSYISSFDNMQMEIAIANEERKLKREVEKAKAHDKLDAKRKADTAFIQKKEHIYNTGKPWNSNNNVRPKGKIGPKNKTTPQRRTGGINW